MKYYDFKQMETDIRATIIKLQGPQITTKFGGRSRTYILNNFQLSRCVMCNVYKYFPQYEYFQLMQFIQNTVKKLRQ